MKKGKLPRKFIFKNKPADEMILAAYVEPLIYGKYLDEYNIKITDEQAYNDLKSCNINTLLQTESMLNKEDNQITLNMFEQLSKRNMNFLFRDKEIVGTENIVTTKTTSELIDYFTKNYIPMSEKYSAFAGIHYIDEPGYKDWKRAKEIKDAFKTVFPNSLFFLNLLQVYAPTWALPNGPYYVPDAEWWLPEDDDYIKYYETYIREANPEIFSYDFYPLVYEFPTLREDYFKQLHLSYKYATKSDTPIFAFIQTGNWDTSTRIPNEYELRWQVNCALAYNTKAIGWFTYWSPEPFFKRMCIDQNGTKTPTYYKVQQINKELLFQDEYILNAAFNGYILSGKTPNGETPVKEDELLSFGNISQITDGNFFIGCFDYYNKDKVYNMYIIVNNTIDKFQKGEIKFKKHLNYTKIYRDNVSKENGNSINFDLTPGDAIIVIEEF